MAELKDYSTICSSAPSEVLATAALGVGERLIAEHAARIRENLALLDRFIARHADRLEMQRPGGGPTVFPRLLGVASADEFCDALLAATGVLLLPGSMFEEAYASHVRMGLGRATFAEVHALTNAVATRMCERHPDIVTMEFYKKDRAGRLFLDTLRNALGATVVAPYSLRGKPGAPVSAPIEWEELDDVTPNGITMRDIAARLDSIGDPWSNLRARPGNVRKATKKLEALD